MNRIHCLCHLQYAASCTAASLLTLTSAHAQVATGTTGIDASGNYQQEVRACKNEMQHEDRATCLREARNAQAEKRRGALGSVVSNYEANALARCDAHQREDRLACQARIRGQGSTSGSVAEGGVLREIETIVTPAPSTAR